MSANTSVKIKRVIGNPVHLAAFGFGAGLSPIAPGTVGTIVGFPLFWLLMGQSVTVKVTVLGGLFVTGIWICDKAGKAVGDADHPGIVWDEITCFAIVLAFMPIRFVWWGSAFAAFRFFDILKFWPASWIDNHMKNGLGVMLDDLVAALYTIAVLLAIQYLLD